MINQNNRKSILNTIGPAMIVAAVVCGPGSILTSSKIGAEFGYSAVWVLVLACILMIFMVNLATRVGTSFTQTPCQEIADRFGRPAAVLIGVVMFLVIASFQSSNNFAVAAGLESFNVASPIWLSMTLLIVLNAISIAFLFLSRELYSAVERLMKILVACMVVAFLINCVFARPSLVAAARGLVPSVPSGDQWLLLALIGTTFSVAAAFYQAYLAREKNWDATNRNAGLIDSVVGISTLGIITLIIMLTSAAVFFGKTEAPKLESAHSISLQLKPLFGTAAQYIFGFGILAGAVSSFLVNALIGGHILSDGLGLGDKIDSKSTKYLTTLALLTGMLVAMVSLWQGTKPVNLIIFAQALTVIGFPILGLTLVYLGFVNRRESTTNPSNSHGETIPLGIWLGAVVGLIVATLLAYRTVLIVMDKISQLSQG